MKKRGMHILETLENQFHFLKLVYQSINNQSSVSRTARPQLKIIN